MGQLFLVFGVLFYGVAIMLYCLTGHILKRIPIFRHQMKRLGHPAKLDEWYNTTFKRGAGIGYISSIGLPWSVCTCNRLL